MSGFQEAKQKGACRRGLPVTKAPDDLLIGSVTDEMSLTAWIACAGEQNFSDVPARHITSTVYDVTSSAERRHVVIARRFPYGDDDMSEAAAA